MSTTFGVKTKDGDLVEVAFRSGTIVWKNDIAYLLPDDTEVIAMDNSSQGIETIGDIKNKISIQQIHEALDKGKDVQWENELYKVHEVKSELNNYSKLSYRDGKALRVTCKSNYFGSLISESDLDKITIL